MSDDPADVAADAPTRAVFRVVLTYSSCLLTVLLYDWIVSWKREYRYIWKERFGPVTILYFILRYFAILRASSTVYLASTEVTVTGCPPWARWQVYSAMAFAATVYVFFILRASAIYGNSWIVVAFLGILASIILILQGIASPYFGVIPWATGHGPCFAGKTPTSSDMLVIFWLGPFIFDTITTVMLLMRILVIRKRGGVHSGIIRLLARDGILYFVIISSANLINVGFYFGAREDIQSINSGMAYDITSIACCRLILSLRYHARKEGSSSTSITSRGLGRSGLDSGSGFKTAPPMSNRRNLDEDEKSNTTSDRFDNHASHIALDTFPSKNARESEEEEALAELKLPQQALRRGGFHSGGKTDRF